MTENNGQAWAQEMAELLITMKTNKERLLTEGETKMLPDALKELEDAYDNVVLAGLNINPILDNGKKTGRPKKGKVRSLLERLSTYKEYVCHFLNNFEVPFDNNQAERDIRMVKVKQKVSGCFRTKDGADDFVAIMSFSSTAHKHGIGIFSAIKSALVSRFDRAALGLPTE